MESVGIMFENSINTKNGVIYKEPKSEYNINYYDSMYRKRIYVYYATKELRDNDFKSIKDYSVSYQKND